MNRKSRRFELKKRRTTLARAKLRCLACERTGQEMTKEHFWPKWLIKHTQAKEVWHTSSTKLNPEAVTIPLCKICNNDFGAKLEAPVKKAFEELESGKGLSDLQAELLARWLWKFEGLMWCAENFDKHESTYSTHWTLKQRILDAPAFEIRPILTLGISLIQKRSPEKDEWPMGIDSTITDRNCLFVSGVFSKVAIIITLSDYKHKVPSEFSLYDFGETPIDRDAKVFFPSEGFEFTDIAVQKTQEVSFILNVLHESWAENLEQSRKLIFSRKRVLLPDDI